jgi:predicted nucleotidyltransferase
MDGMILNIVIPQTIEAEIQRRIDAAEKEHNVKVLYAVESGSRAWGFASPNSDYDVRFIYAHPKDWYVAVDLEEKRDVIEYPIVDEIDISGWDVRKALRLFRKSNPSFVEWLHSSIIYRDDGVFAATARSILESSYSINKGIYHYRSMAKTNYRGYLRKPMVPLKKYFYVLRPLLSILWMENQGTPAPIEFDKLRGLVKSNTELDEAITDLIERKKLALEKEIAPTVPVINEFIVSELDRLEDYQGTELGKSFDLDTLNQLFHKVID